MACAPDWREAEARALAVVEQFGGTFARDPDYEGESVGKVDLTGKPVSDADVNVLTGLAGLHNLVLRETRITDAGLAHLKRARRLRVLDLDQTRVSDAGLAHLGELTSLRGLYLARTEVTDAGLAALSPLKKLRELGLRRHRSHGCRSHSYRRANRTPRSRPPGNPSHRRRLGISEGTFQTPEALARRHESK